MLIALVSRLATWRPARLTVRIRTRYGDFQGAAGRGLRARGARRGWHRRLPDRRREAPLRRQGHLSRPSFSDVQGLKTGAPFASAASTSATCRASATAKTRPTTASMSTCTSPSAKRCASSQDTRRCASQTKGLLGDKMIELSGRAPPKAPPVAPEGYIKGEDPTDFTSLFSEVGTMTKHAAADPRQPESRRKRSPTQQLHEDLRGSVHSVNVILKEIAEGNGYVHRFLADPAEAERVSHLVVDARSRRDRARGHARRGAQGRRSRQPGPGLRARDPLRREGGPTRSRNSAALRARSPRPCAASARAMASRTRSSTAATTLRSRSRPTSGRSPATCARSSPTFGPARGRWGRCSSTRRSTRT